MTDRAESLFTQAGGKLLTFTLGKREYGIEILSAREVVGMIEPEPVPKTPAFMKGVINLRGLIIPVIDLRSRLGIPEGEANEENCIMVVDIGKRKTGCIIDALVGVTTIERSQFEGQIEMGAHIHTEFILGMAKVDKRVILILDMERVLENEELLELAAL